MDRIATTVGEQRDLAENPGLRAIVIWPDRELTASSDLSVLKTLAESDTGPISILCPDGDPTMARTLENALESESGGDRKVTVRCPKTSELPSHIYDIIHAGGEP